MPESYVVVSCIFILFMTLVWYLLLKAPLKGFILGVCLVYFSFLMLWLDNGLYYLVDLLFYSSFAAAIGYLFTNRVGLVLTVPLGLAVFSWSYINLFYAPVSMYYFIHFLITPEQMFSFEMNWNESWKKWLLSSSIILPSIIIYIITRCFRLPKYDRTVEASSKAIDS